MSLYLEEEGEITLPFETKEVADLVVEKPHWNMRDVLMKQRSICC